MHHPIKLAIVGASSTGKTTLLTHLEEKYKGNKHIAFVHESARQFFNENQVDNQFDFANQEKILALALLNEKLATETNPKVILTDTSALEVMFYTKVHGDEEGTKRLRERLESYIPTYTKFLLLNPEDVQFENDEVRRESKQIRDTIHSMLVAFYHQEKLPFALISGTILEREKRIRDIIQTYL
ncbi:MAG: ATP-binding protein [Candidatus Levybacteria bacterium]|nr:ATP-binding protein [Candidatus Levybacteria bacterium]